MFPNKILRLQETQSFDTATAKSIIWCDVSQLFFKDFYLMYLRCDAFLKYCDKNLVLTPPSSLKICWQVRDPSTTLSYLCTATYVLAEQVLAILEALEVFLLVHNFCGSHHATTVVCAITTYYQLQLPRGWRPYSRLSFPQTVSACPWVQLENSALFISAVTRRCGVP